jgi:hypothetical protein
VQAIAARRLSHLIQWLGPSMPHSLEYCALLRSTSLDACAGTTWAGPRTGKYPLSHLLRRVVPRPDASARQESLLGPVYLPLETICRNSRHWCSLLSRRVRNAVSETRLLKADCLLSCCGGSTLQPCPLSNRLLRRREHVKTVPCA